MAASPLSLAAIAIYLLVFAATTRSAIVAHQQHQRPWHLRSWVILAGFFLLLMLARWFDAEELLRDHLRSLIRADSSYGERGSFQRPLAAGLVALAGAAVGWWFYRTARGIRGRRNIAVMTALGGGLGMLILIAMRLISLHQLDQLLYGPLKANWFADLGMSGLIAFAAYHYVRIVRG